MSSSPNPNSEKAKNENLKNQRLSLPESFEDIVLLRSINVEAAVIRPQFVAVGSVIVLVEEDDCLAVDHLPN